MKGKVIFNWSGGKDSALCLYKILRAKQYEVMCLLTSVNQQYQRISMHGVRVGLLDAQAKSIGLPLIKMQVPEMSTMDSYDQIVATTLSELKAKGAVASVFGDIFLEDLRAYRENKLSLLNLKGVFPLWNIPSGTLIREFIDLGFKTVVTCVNERCLDKSFAGRIIDHDFLDDLPDHVDPCGENGEFHTFVFDGPIFCNPIPFVKGEVVYRQYSNAKQNGHSSVDTNDNFGSQDAILSNGFWYCDLLLQETC